MDNLSGSSGPIDAKEVQSAIPESRIRAEIDLSIPTDLSGKICKSQPGIGEVPFLNSDEATKGCTFEKSSADSQLRGKLQLIDAYSLGKDQAVHLETDLNLAGPSTGSGVIIAQNVIANTGEQECLALTDRHVVKGNVLQERMFETAGFFSDKDIDPVTTARMSDGKVYPAEVRTLDEARDLAVVAIRTGERTELVCKPAKFPEENKEIIFDDVVYTVGFPAFSETPYLSVGKFAGKMTLDELDRQGGVDFGTGEDTKREILRHSLPVRGGNSGGFVFDSDNSLIGLVSRRNPKMGLSFSTPISKADLVDLIEKSKTPQ